MVENKRSSLVKPSLETLFHIDFEWWKDHDANWRIFLYDYLCPEHQQVFKDQDKDIIIDYIDPLTAEVGKVDGLLHTLMHHCAQQEGFIHKNLSIVEIVFRIFLANGNEPLSPQALSALSGKSPTVILRTFSSSNVFKGIRPIIK